MVICIDFDGTCVTHDFPMVGMDIGAVPVMKRLYEAGHQFILFTMRSDIENPTSTDYNINPTGGKYLTDAINWFKDNDIPLYGVNTNPSQSKWTKSPKAYGELYIDDAALGCPLKMNLSISSKPFVDWQEVERILINMKLID